MGGKEDEEGTEGTEGGTFYRGVSPAAVLDAFSIASSSFSISYRDLNAQSFLRT